MIKIAENDIFPERFIHKILGKPHQPTCVFIGGIHGNEPSGIVAIQHVFDTIEQEGIEVKGSIIGLRGNLQAIALGKRFLTHDLNRVWTQKKLDELSKDSKVAEAKEMAEIKQYLDSTIANATASLYFVDLHTTSSHSPPFVILDDTIRNRTLANAMPIPKVLGFLEQLQGTILGYYGDKGPVTLVIEAGQHVEHSSEQRHIAAIWVVLVETGIISKKQAPFKESVELLKQASQPFPEVVETIKRYGLAINDAFEMQPGFENFCTVQEGQLLAHHNNIPVLADSKSMLFMPLYQKQGEDGFFVVSPIPKFWIVLSKLFRKLKTYKYLHYLPGIKKNPKNQFSFIVNQKIAGYKTMEVLHLLGFRKEIERGHITYISRRPYDFKGPWD